MSASTVRVVRKGQLLFVSNPSQQVRDLCENALTYQKVIHLRGEEARARNRKVDIRSIGCFKVIPDPHGQLPPVLLTGAGFFSRLEAVFRRNGLGVEYIDNTPAPANPNVYVPQWDRLANVSWRHRQEECVRTITQTDRGRIRSPTAWGKSFLIAQLARLYPYAKIGVTTYAKDVLQLLYNGLDSELESASVGMITGSQKTDPTRRILCVSAGSLHHLQKYMPNEPDFLIVDEVHEFATAERLKSLGRFGRARIFAFSAQKVGDRNDGADFELEGPCGPLIFDMEYTEAVEHDAVVQLRVMMHDVVMDYNPISDTNHPTAIDRNGLWRNKTRNEIIASVAKYWRSLDKQVLISVNVVEHAIFLKKLLPDFELVYGENGMPPKDREQYIRWKLITADEPQMTMRRRLLLTEQFSRGELRGAIATTVWNRGVNFTGLQVLIRADGKSSAISDTQIPGRLARLSEDKPYGLLVDFLDQFDNRLARRASERRRRYRHMGWELLEPPASQPSLFRKAQLHVE